MTLLSATSQLQLRALCPPRLLFSIPQQPPQDLAARTLWNDINKLHTSFQPLMSRLMVLHPFTDISLNQGVVFFDADGCGFHNVGFGDFAGCGVGDGDDGAVRDGGVREEVGFEFGGGDLETLGGG